jgi:outer membrane protein assembly complex protein YaeT
MNAIERFSRSARRPAGVITGLLLFGAVCLAQTPTAPPAKLMVADVLPDGNRSVPTQKIMSIIKTRPGSEFSQETVNDDVRELYKTRLFANVRADIRRTPDGRVTVYFLLAELPSAVQEIIYDGAKHMKPDELEKTTGLRKGMPLNPVANSLAATALVKAYHEEGRMWAGVELVEGDKAGDTRVVFKITEGPIVRISSIEITGNTFVHAARLHTQLVESRALLGCIGGKFNPAAADADVAKLEEYYRTFGFHDVRVSRELKLDEANQGSVKLIFHIHEGVRYRVGQVDVVNNKYYDREKLLTLTSLHSGDWYNDANAKGDVEGIKILYGYEGRNADVIKRLTYKPGEVDVRYDIEERPIARVGQVNVIGNDVTKMNVILRQVPLYPGQILTYPNLRAAERNLAKLSIFEADAQTGTRPTVNVIDDDPNNPYKDILIQVKETHTGSLMFGVGVNSDAGLTGSIVLNERNFDILRPPTSLEDFLSGKAWRGAGQEFRIEAVPGTQLQRYTVSFREPYLFDSLFSFGVSGYYYQRQYNEYFEERLGARFTLGRQLAPHWSASAGIRVERVGVLNIPDNLAAEYTALGIPYNTLFGAPPEITNDEGEHFIIGFRAGVTYDTRDSYLRATSGWLVDLAFEEVTGDYTFPVFSAEVNKYWTIYQRADNSGRHVLAARSALSITTSEAPVFERFYAGGFRSMRGFEFRGVGPDVNGFKVGGDFMWLNSLEYQVPILANDQLYGVAFLDSGTVEARPDLNNYRVSAGVGLRVVVPMLGPVPIALDFGFPIVKASTDNTQVFSFWVGFFH